jgi:hypothetical protein
MSFDLQSSHCSPVLGMSQLNNKNWGRTLRDVDAKTDDDTTTYERANMVWQRNNLDDSANPDEDDAEADAEATTEVIRDVGSEGKRADSTNVV